VFSAAAVAAFCAGVGVLLQAASANARQQAPASAIVQARARLALRADSSRATMDGLLCCRRANLSVDAGGS
jgi:hypothetical protein